MTYQEMLAELGQAGWQVKTAEMVGRLPRTAPASRIADGHRGGLTEKQLSAPMSIRLFFDGVVPGLAKVVREHIDPLERRIAALERRP